MPQVGGGDTPKAPRRRRPLSVFPRPLSSRATRRPKQASQRSAAWGRTRPRTEGASKGVSAVMRWRRAGGLHVSTLHPTSFYIVGSQEALLVAPGPTPPTLSRTCPIGEALLPQPWRSTAGGEQSPPVP